jgi:MscS family membrane protein
LRNRQITRLCCISLFAVFCVLAWPQASLPGASQAPAPAAAPKDPLGRTTPRSTVIGFLAAARKDDFEVASGYLNTPVKGKAAEELARKLSVVLDQRLPARLNELSEKPEGSLRDALHPERDLVGTILTSNGSVEIELERVDRGKNGPIWLFSRQTLESVPEIYDETDVVDIESVLPSFLVTRRIAGIPLFEWLVVFLGLPLIYFSTMLLNRVLGSLTGSVRRSLERKKDLPNPVILPPSVRLLFIALAIRWLMSKVHLSLLARQFWSSISVVIAVAAVVWILIYISGRVEDYAVRRLIRRRMAGASSVLRLARRVINALLVFAGVIAVLYNFGVNPTAALAGLGVGGIAVALAAQKTLENVIGGASLIFDQVIRVGDTLKVGEMTGTVDEIGLRSTRLRTNDRTLVSIPNGQVATMSLETLSARDKFWFHHLVGLRYETTMAQMRSVLDGIQKLLLDHSSAERDSVRVRFLAFGANSLDVEIFAYLYARDWNQFLEIQEGLLFSIMETIEQIKVQIALPSRTVYVASGSFGTVSGAGRLDDRLSDGEELSIEEAHSGSVAEKRKGVPKSPN